MRKTTALLILVGLLLSATSSGTVWDVTLEIDDTGSIVSGSGFSEPVTGRMFTEAGYLAGHLVIGGAASPADEIMFQEAFAEGDSLLWGGWSGPWWTIK